MKRRILWGMAGGMTASLGVTMWLLLSQGRGREAVPLHLCSVSALLALAVSLGLRGGAVDFLWYLGLPGALLALMFPAPAQSDYQLLFNLSYAATHLLIVLVPLRLMRCGVHPRTGRTAVMMLALQGLALAANAANRALGTNFLFLMGPPAGTPLVYAYALGRPAYLAVLEGIMLGVCLVQSAALRIGSAAAGAGACIRRAV